MIGHQPLMSAECIVIRLHNVFHFLLYPCRVDTTFYNAEVYNLLPDNRLWITHEFVMLPNHVNVGGNYEPTAHGGPPTQDDPHL